MNTQREQELAAKREQEAARRTRIKAANERLAALPDKVRGKVHDRANTLEGEARRAGKRDAHVSFLERALDEQAVTDSGRRVIGLRDKDQAALDAATATVAKEIATDLADKALRLRRGGMTLAEVAAELEVGAGAVRSILGDEPRGGKPKGKKSTVPAQRKAAREVRGEGVERQEKCPGCGEWRNGEQNGDGRYVVESDFREGRGDCRACYNRRWREGRDRRRQSARVGK